MKYSSAMNRAALAAGSAIFLALIYYLGPAEILRVLKNTRLGYLAATLPAFALTSYVRLYKWKLMRDRMGSKISFAELSGVYFSSKFWGMVSPMRSGEALPALLNAEQRGRLLSIVLYDRIVETFQTLIVFGGLFFLFYGIFFEAGTGVALSGILLVMTLAVFIVLDKRAGEGVFLAIDKCLGLLGGSRAVNRLKRITAVLRNDMESFYAATRSYFSVAFTSGMLMLTFVGWGLDMVMWLLLFKAVGADVTLWVAVAGVVVTAMAGSLSPVPGGLGVADLSFVVVLGYFGHTVEAGGVIILARVFFSLYIYLGYAIFGRLMPKRS